MCSIRENKVISEPMVLPAGRKFTNTRIIFAQKLDERGDVDRFKARLVYSHFWKNNDVDWGKLFFSCC